MKSKRFDALFSQPTRVPALRSTENQPIHQVLVWQRLTHDGLGWTWYVTECDRASGLAFGFVDGDEPEWGYFDLDELFANGVRALPDRLPVPITHFLPHLDASTEGAVVHEARWRPWDPRVP